MCCTLGAYCSGCGMCFLAGGDRLKITNLIGNEYKGSIGKSITASKWKGRNYLKKWFKPTNPNTARQQLIRGYMGTANSTWQGLNNFQKAAYYWYQRYRKTNISPFNAMVGSFITILNGDLLYVSPPVGQIQVQEVITLDPISGAQVIVRKAGQATNYMLTYSAADGNTGQSIAAEDELYDITITHPDYELYTVTGQTAVQIVAAHLMTPL